ncbi:MAG: tRNA (guanosine(37)-N1)-methyltransferase TrmD [Candidatus Ancaeobacter aquaticus]|nr:tRNA (guanosine(37)-N1)-methyltransferase TrmD [Candidatus Ancaeobacter aquaticus]
MERNSEKIKKCKRKETRKVKRARLLIDVLSLFPNMCNGPLHESIIGKALSAGIIDVKLHNIRDYAEGKHKITDDRPYGGGPGMVMKPEPIYNAVSVLRKKKTKVILLTPEGETFCQPCAEELSKETHLIFICGHYEGFDERVKSVVDKEISIGDYVLTNGALAAMVVVDTVARLIPGVVGCEESIKQDSFSDALLDWPHYTRPEVFRGEKVPRVLLSGDHKKIESWRRQQAIKRTVEKENKLNISVKRRNKTI